MWVLSEGVVVVVRGRALFGADRTGEGKRKGGLVWSGAMAHG